LSVECEVREFVCSIEALSRLVAFAEAEDDDGAFAVPLREGAETMVSVGEGRDDGTACLEQADDIGDRTRGDRPGVSRGGGSGLDLLPGGRVGKVGLEPEVA